MAIKRGSDPTAVIEQGKFILSDSIFVYGVCGKPGKVTRLAGKRVYYERLRGDEAGSETHINNDKIKFVCDTEEEVAALLDVDKDSVAMTGAAVTNVEDQHRDHFDNRILKLLVVG